MGIARSSGKDTVGLQDRKHYEHLSQHWKACFDKLKPDY
jgi:hypothetical protein